MPPSVSALETMSTAEAKLEGPRLLHALLWAPRASHKIFNGWIKVRQLYLFTYFYGDLLHLFSPDFFTHNLPEKVVTIDNFYCFFTLDPDPNVFPFYVLGWSCTAKFDHPES